MEKIQVFNRHSLALRLEALKAEKEKQENLINAHVDQFCFTLQNPASFIKQQVSELASDREFRNNLFTVCLNAITKYFMRKQSESSTTKNSVLEKLLSKFTGTQTKDNGIDIIKIVRSVLGRK